MRSFWLSVFICGLVVATAYGEEDRLNEVDTEEDLHNGDVKSQELKAKKEASSYGGGDIDGRGRLINLLLGGYDKRNYPTNMTVTFGLALLGIDVNEKRHSLEADVWLRLKWNDKRLTWNKADFGVDVLRMRSDAIWHPDTTLYNSVELPGMMNCWDSNTIIYPNGDVLWVPPCHLSAHCNLTLWKDPFGPQKCELKFGSWTFDGLSMGLDFYDNEKKADISDFRQSPHWDLITNEATRIEKFYDCCTEPYISLTFNLTVQRKKTSSAECQL